MNDEVEDADARKAWQRMTAIRMRRGWYEDNCHLFKLVVVETNYRRVTIFWADGQIETLVEKHSAIMTNLPRDVRPAHIVFI